MNNEFDLNWPYRFGQPTQSALLKAEPADFQVFEDLGFMPSGQGEHLFVRIRKLAKTPLGWLNYCLNIPGCHFRRSAGPGLKIVTR